ncbi:MAG TPA: hypothetical protein VFK85_12500, partial [Anaeromyxobacteraceae bacterium]|nr:hypothetical protein [Anaeromyxobacteraceae bacterium]
APAVPIDAAGVYLPPLKEKTQYLVVVTSDVKDAQDRPMRRSTLMDLVFTFAGDLCAPANDLANCTSRIPGVSNADAAGLQRLRASVKPALQGLGLADCSGSAPCAVLAYTVKTQSVKDVSVQLAALPFSVEASAAVFVPSGTVPFNTQVQFGIPAAAFPNVAKFVETTIPMLNAIQGSTGAFDPALATPAFLGNPANINPVKALVAIPSATGPASGPAIAAAPFCPGSTTIRCVPLVIFHHGLNGARYQMIAAADALAAKGFVVAAIDAPYHGERAFCAQNSDCAVGPTTDGVCTPNPALATPIDTTPPGTCTTGSLKRNDSLSTVASGNYFITANFFRIRDGIRQDQLDHAVLVHALARPPAAPVRQPSATPDLVTEIATTAGIAVDPREVRYTGISLGGIVGTSVVATNPRIKRAVLNVPGGTLVDVFTNSPAFQSRLAPIFAGLGVDVTKVSPTLPGGGANPNFDAAQAARYGQTLAIAKWVLDPADPVNYAANVATKVAPTDATIQGLFAALTAGGVAATTTQAYGQMVVNDQVIMNPYNSLLLRLTGIPTTVYDPTAIPAESRHGLLLANFTSAAKPVGDVIRGDLASFLETAAAPPPTRTIP